MAQKIYCKNCGNSFSSVSTLTASACFRHPDGPKEGKHVLYEGDEKPKRTRKHCGSEYSSISSMAALSCFRHPAGANKGEHSPAL